MPADIGQITAQLTALVRAKTGDAGARVTGVTPLPGHAGFGYSFVLERMTAGGPAGRLVLRVAPEGVRIAGPADVVRQAKIMASLADTEVEVPPIIWYGDEAEFFRRPYFVDGFVEGFKLAEVTLPRDETVALARAAIATGEVDGLFFEVHPDPDHAPSDGPNMIPLSDLAPLLETLAAIDAARRKAEGRRRA